MGIFRGEKGIIACDDDIDYSMSSTSFQRLLTCHEIKAYLQKKGLRAAKIKPGFAKLFWVKGLPVIGKNKKVRTFTYPFVDISEVILTGTPYGRYRCSYTNKLWPYDYQHEKNLFPLQQLPFGGSKAMAPATTHFIDTYYPNWTGVVRTQRFDHRNHRFLKKELFAEREFKILKS